jgi:uncharacterized membrane protein
VEEMLAQTSIAGKQQVLWYTRGNANVNPSARYHSVDALRGLIMMIMAIDHASPHRPAARHRILGGRR